MPEFKVDPKLTPGLAPMPLASQLRIVGARGRSASTAFTSWAF